MLLTPGLHISGVRWAGGWRGRSSKSINGQYVRSRCTVERKKKTTLAKGDRKCIVGTMLFCVTWPGKAPMPCLLSRNLRNVREKAGDRSAKRSFLEAGARRTERVKAWGRSCLEGFRGPSVRAERAREKDGRAAWDGERDRSP